MPASNMGEIIVTMESEMMDEVLRRVAGAISELRRELAIRRNAYPRFIQSHRLTAEDANRQWRRLFDAHGLLMAVLSGLPIEHPHALEATPAKTPLPIRFDGEGRVSLVAEGGE